MIKLCIPLLLIVCWSTSRTEELRWNWKKINTKVAKFKRNFIFGTAVAEYQVSGAENCPDCNWAGWDFALDKNGKWRILDGQKSGKACDFWNRFEADIELLKKMKVKAFRFSIEWSKIEPQLGKINKEAIAHYHKLMDCLIKAGIKPVVTLHHFTHPTWFENMGGFEDHRNIPYFVNFCKRMVKEYDQKVMMWATFNEPGVYVFQGYIRGVWPPGKVGINRATWVTRNMLKAHVLAYQDMKEVCPNAQVGIVHSVTQFEPFNDNYLERTVCNKLNALFHEGITKFFETGTYEVYVPLLASIEYKNPEATKSLDFFGINYYSHVLLQIDFSFQGQAYRKGEIKTDMPYCIYPEGLYRAIKDISDRIAKPQDIPIYITENGIADKYDNRRAEYIERYTYALYKAIEEGYDVRGYFYWSLIDNFEWDHGYTQKFGLYHVDMKTQKRTLRFGAQPYLDLIARTYADEKTSTLADPVVKYVMRRENHVSMHA